MNYQNRPRIESLLSQLQLVEPSQRLDDSIARLADDAAATSLRPARQFGWKAVVFTALAASLLGLLTGVATSVQNPEGPRIASHSLRNVSATQVFQAMHGHSGNLSFQVCSSCHVFNSTNEQVVQKWSVNDREFAASLGLPNCSMCHLQNDALMATELGSKG
jgi:anti-sigma-K factor RskA